MDGNTKKNHTIDEAFTAKLRPPIDAVQITTGRGLLRVGINAASMRPGPMVHKTDAEEQEESEDE